MSRSNVRIRQTSDGQQWISSRELTENIFGGSRRTQADLTRRFFGAGITPESIECVLRMAENGYMRDLTDLTKESMFLDPHLMSVVSKRFRALAAVKPKVVAATGPGVDPARAAQYAEEVRIQLSLIPNFRQQVTRLNWGHYNGRAALEKVWRETRGGAFQYEIGELNWLHARRLAFGPERDLRIQDGSWGGIPFEDSGLPIERIPHKFITYKPQMFDEVQEREGLGPRALYWSYMKRFTWRERMVLLEVFGKPWRIMTVAQGAQLYDADALDELQDRADELGANSSAAFPAGVTLDLKNADPKSTDPHDKTSDKCDDQISKLFLGNTSTTDAKPSGLGSSMSLVHQDGETLIISADGWGIGDCLTWHIARDFVILNHGEDEAINAPTIELNYESAPDQTVEIDRAVKVFGLGIPLKTEEVYRRCGWEKPSEGDEVMAQQAAPALAVPGAPSATGGLVSASVVPSTEGGSGDPVLPLAQAASRSLRLSRLSRDYFSGH